MTDRARHLPPVSVDRPDHRSESSVIVVARPTTLRRSFVRGANRLLTELGTVSKSGLSERAVWSLPQSERLGQRH